MMVIDIRDYSQYLKGHLKGAISIPFSLLYISPNQYLEKDKTYHIYCDTGVRSSLLVRHLNLQGYHCVNLDGGYVKHLFKS